MDGLTDLRDELMQDDAFRESYEERTRLVCYGHMIRHAREAKQLTRAELAGQLNIPESEIRRLENGEGVEGPTVEMRQALAQALGSAPGGGFGAPLPTELAVWLDSGPAAGVDIGARVVHDIARGMLVGKVPATGETFEAYDPREMAELLFAAGVQPGHVSMPDWREGDIAPAAGVKVALNFRLRQLTQAPERRAALHAVPVIDREGRPPYVRLSDIPSPWRDTFRAALHGSACPAISGEDECAYAWDWRDWLDGRFPR